MKKFAYTVVVSFLPFLLYLFFVDGKIGAYSLAVGFVFVGLGTYFVSYLHYKVHLPKDLTFLPWLQLIVWSASLTLVVIVRIGLLFLSVSSNIMTLMMLFCTTGCFMNAVIAPFESDVVGADEMEESHSFYDDEAVSW